MNLSKLLSEFNTDEEYLLWLESKTFEELEEFFRPYFNVTRPEKSLRDLGSSKSNGGGGVRKSDLSKASKDKLTNLDDQQKAFLEAQGFGDLFTKKGK